jgi:hypothetical protein
VQGPESFLTQLGIELPGYMDSARPAIMDANYRISIGYESFIFSDSANLKKFESNLTKYCGVLTDPVTLKRFKPKRKSPKFTHNQRLFIFASDSTRQVFEKMPDMYYLPNFEMRPRETVKTPD